ncbi:MAG: 2-oxo acid dehydrogenase subunit E2 [Firmicutes bacterium]|nr:2-oxo acid dehydrogenase subunit E2 [Bacillota bacterium]MDY2807371.1 2-oxo acid dehydrogenase subunit E2 [Oscillospiraceae bacterium]
MAEGVLMPKAGITVESCVIGEWKKNVGDQVAVGDILFTYETDKAEFECESTAAGTLLAQFYAEGDEVPCLVNVCAVGNPGEDVEALRNAAPAAEAPAAPAAAAAAAAAPAAAVKPDGPCAQAVIMPKEGITVESCIIGEWKKNVGDAVAVGDVLFTYETDKAEFECPSTAAGTLLAKFFEDGDEVPCLVNVCAVGNPGDAYEFLKPGAEAPAPAAEAPAAEAPAAAAAPAAPKAELTAISPRAMAKAVANNVNPALATGTGPKGRIIERDIDKLIASGAAAAYAAPAAAEETAFEDVKFGPVRKATAKSMTKSLSTMAQLTQQYSFDASQIQAYRAMLKPMDAPMGKISLNDMVMFAVAKTIKSCPDLNANMVEDNVIRHFSHVNLGFACDTPRGLLVPTIFHADEMSLLELSMEAKRLAAAARDGSLSPDEMTGATFTVTNIGSFGCEAFTPVVNPPQIGILGVCNIQTKIKSAKDGMIETYPAMGLSLTFDHRALDGAPAARYMSELCKSLESFMTLMAK